MKKFAVILYPDFSLQEITCLTSVLTLWFGEKLDFIASEDKEYLSEEGFVIRPTKIIGNIKAKNYDCLILPGTMNPLPALYDEKLIDFLREGIDSELCLWQFHLHQYCYLNQAFSKIKNLLRDILCR